MEAILKTSISTITEKAIALVQQMTLDEKIGQMTQVEKNSLTPEDVRTYFIGSVLSGGGGNPTPNTINDWREMVEAFKASARQTRLGIPLIYGVDAVHGHNNVYGATIFPHNIGLGAAGDPELVKRIGRATAVEVAATGVRWNFAPAVSVPQDIRWGRTYEGYSEQTDLVNLMGAAYVEGLQGDLSAPTGVLASVKHYVGDGGTAWNSVSTYDWISMDLWNNLGNFPKWTLDQGQTIGDDAILRKRHLPPYRSAIEAGALNIMASYSSFEGEKCHASRYLLSEVLKEELQFEGFVVSDWMALDQLDRDFAQAVATSINAGMDMIMVPFDFKRFIDTTRQLVADGHIPISRIDDAVKRILIAKLALDLWNESADKPAFFDEVGSNSHRQLAREAVQKSQVLLKNNGVLPLSPGTSSILCAGQGLDDIGYQCGGWTIEWQGKTGPITLGTTILDGIKNHAQGMVERFDMDSSGSNFDVGLVAVAEIPYAEGEGDTDNLNLNEDQIKLIQEVRARVDKLVLLIISGRPLIITEVIDDCDAVVACWLPGSEGDAVADNLFGVTPYSGKLSYTWPAAMTDIANPQGAALFPVGHGLSG